MGGHFFNNDGLPFWAGHITLWQRWRAVVAVDCCIFLCVFLAVQIYYGVGDIFGIKIKRPYWLAVVSFYGEITTLIFVYSLPAIAAFETMFGILLEGDVLKAA